jgi:hypothetical protein
VDADEKSDGDRVVDSGAELATTIDGSVVSVCAAVSVAVDVA